VKDIVVGSLVIFIEDFQSETIPNVGIVLEVIVFDELIGDFYGVEVVWYAVLFGEVDMVVSSEMVTLLN
jgi:hypothetical protein|tara:strand:+ start:337 stop:543 length:207 start_codon:yes stop_codon:yes gene_type:complete